MLDYKYAYLFGAVLFLIPWFILFIWRKDYRREMLVVSFITAIGSFATAYFWWTADWWRPLTITGTIVGFEDLILGFSNGGIAAVIYELVYKKHFSLRKKQKINNRGYVVFIMFLCLTGLLFWGVNLTSFIASTIALSIVGIYLVLTRRDLFTDAVASGVLMAIVSLPVYWACIFIWPSFVDLMWPFSTLLGIRFVGIPIEDVVFYFLFGFVTGPIYEYWQNMRLTRK